MCRRHSGACPAAERKRCDLAESLRTCRRSPHHTHHVATPQPRCRAGRDGVACRSPPGAAAIATNPHPPNGNGTARWQLIVSIAIVLIAASSGDSAPASTARRASGIRDCTIRCACSSVRVLVWGVGRGVVKLTPRPFGLSPPAVRGSRADGLATAPPALPLGSPTAPSGVPTGAAFAAMADNRGQSAAIVPAARFAMDAAALSGSLIRHSGWSWKAARAEPSMLRRSAMPSGEGQR